MPGSIIRLKYVNLLNGGIVRSDHQIISPNIGLARTFKEWRSWNKTAGVFGKSAGVLKEDLFEMLLKESDGQKEAAM